MTSDDRVAVPLLLSSFALSDASLRFCVASNAANFKERVRWVRPDNGQTIRLKVWAQRLSNGKLQGWIRENHADQALAKLEELIS